MPTATPTRRSLPLHSLRIASPCRASWDEMRGDERVRFCGKCEKSVYNLSAMTRDEAEALVSDHEGDLCVRMYLRSDGTVMTQDCPVGVRAKWVRRAATAAGGALLAAQALSLSKNTGSTCASHQPMMGAVAVSTSALGQNDEVPVPAVMGTAAVPTSEPRVVMGGPVPSHEIMGRPASAPVDRPPRAAMGHVSPRAITR